MSESKIQINERKIRNAIRKEKEAREQLMWKKLSATDPYISMTIERARVISTPRTIKAGWTLDPEGSIQFIDGGWEDE